MRTVVAEKCIVTVKFALGSTPRSNLGQLGAACNPPFLLLVTLVTLSTLSYIKKDFIEGRGGVGGYLYARVLVTLLYTRAYAGKAPRIRAYIRARILPYMPNR